MNEVTQIQGEVSIEVAKANAQLAAIINKLELLQKSADNIDASAQLKKLGKDASALNDPLASLQRKIIGLFALHQIKEFTTDVVKATNISRGLTVAFETIEGSAEAGAKALQFVNQEAERLGINATIAAQGYKNLSASARVANLSIADTERLFTAVAGAGRVLNLSNDELDGTLRALSQMMSKGKVTAEELRGQLGERLPGAIGIMAKALGVSTQKLDQMMVKGELISKDVLPKFATELLNTFGPGVDKSSKSAAAQFERMGNAIFNLKVAIGESGLVDFLASAAAGATKLMNILSGQKLQDFSKNVFTASDVIESQSLKLRDAAFALSDYERAITRIPKELVPHYEKEIEKTKQKINELVASIGTLEERIVKNAAAASPAVFALQKEFDSWAESINNTSDIAKLFERQMAFLEQRFRSGAISAAQYTQEAINAAEAMSKATGQNFESPEVDTSKKERDEQFFTEQQERADALALSLSSEEDQIKASMERRLIELENAAMSNEYIFRNAAEMELRIREETADKLEELERQKLQTQTEYASNQINLAQSLGSAILELTGAGAKKQFKLQKAAAIAQGIVAAYQSIMTSYAAGAKINPYVGAAFAALAAVTQFATLSKLASTNENSSTVAGTTSAASPTVASDTDSSRLSDSPASAGASAQRQIPQQNLTIVLEGSTVSDEQVVELAEKMAELSRNGRIQANIQRTF